MRIDKAFTLRLPLGWRKAFGLTPPPTADQMYVLLLCNCKLVRFFSTLPESSLDKSKVLSII